MASKNTKKVLRKIYSQNKNFRPQQNPVSWNKSVVYIKAKDKRMQFNSLFRPLYAALYKEMMEEGCVKKEAKLRAKAKTKEIVKTKLAEQAAAQQSSAGQNEVQS